MDNSFNPIKLLKKRTRFSIVEAVALAVNGDSLSYRALYCQCYNKEKMPNDFQYIFDMLTTEIKMQGVKADICKHEDYHYSDNYSVYVDEYNWLETTILFQDMKDFLTLIDFKKSYVFFDHDNDLNASDIPPYLNKNHPFYSNELHACIDAWLAIHNNPELLNKTTPKEALKRQLKSIAKIHNLEADFKNENGAPLERTSQVVNWKGSGASRVYSAQEIQDLKIKIQESFYKATPLTLKNAPFKEVKEYQYDTNDIPF